jgi:DMSO/TMAO reductase YedYZ molybdopterin-dependent catalytic subunit
MFSYTDPRTLLGGTTMADLVSRREVLQGLVAAGIALGTDWPALAQGEVVIPFTDLPAPAPNRIPPTLETFLTANDAFFAVQHYPVPPVMNPAAYRLRITGLVERPMELTLADLKKRARIEHVVGFECSGNNNARGNPLIGNARWAGTSLAAILKDARVKATAREVVCFSFDSGEEEIVHGGAPEKVMQHFARGLTVEDASRPDVMLAWEMNGVDLPHPHGAPIRLVVPGWYGVANVKWLDRIHVQDSRFMGRFMARDYVTLRGEQVGNETVWNETSVSRTQLKSAVARLTRSDATLKVTGFALTDGTPLKSIEVSVDGGPWKPAALDSRNTTYSWQLFTYSFPTLPPGDHTVVSRATDARGNVQPTDAEISGKKTRWENNGQFVRKFKV